MSVLPEHFSVGQTPNTQPLDTEKWDTSSKNHKVCSNGLAATFSSSFSLLTHLSHLVTLPLPSLVGSEPTIHLAMRSLLPLNMSYACAQAPGRVWASSVGDLRLLFASLDHERTKKRACLGKIKRSLKNQKNLQQQIQIPIPATW